jgi:hypothetical protein
MRTDTFGLLALFLIASVGAAALATAPVGAGNSPVTGDVSALVQFGGQVLGIVAILAGAGAVIGGLT